jgi:hypothetical protein
VKIKEGLKATYVEMILLLVAFVAIGLLKGIDTTVFLSLFLLLFALISYSMIGIYEYRRGLKDKWIVYKIVGAVLVGLIVYSKYGSFAFFKTLFFSLLLVVIIIALTGFTKSNK